MLKGDKFYKDLEGGMKILKSKFPISAEISERIKAEKKKLEQFMLS